MRKFNLTSLIAGLFVAGTISFIILYTIQYDVQTYHKEIPFYTQHLLVLAGIFYLCGCVLSVKFLRKRMKKKKH